MKKSVFVKSSYFFILSVFFVVCIFAILEGYTINHFNKQIENVYTNSINYSSNYWANQFLVANRELKSLINKNNNTDFNVLCRTEDPELISEKESNLQNDLTNLSIINGNQIVFFAFIPEKKIKCLSVSYIDFIHEEGMAELEKYVQEYNEGNTAQWNDIQLEGNRYFIHLYNHKEGVSGCFISCDNVLNDILPANQEGNVYMTNMNGNYFYGNQSDEGHMFFYYERAIRMINKKICVEVPYSSFVNGNSYMFISILIAMMAALLLLFLRFLHQKKVVYDPMVKLENAMVAFSEGNTSIRMESYQYNNEIKVLYETFNRMADQIVNLNINVYETNLEKNKIYSQFLRVQIQPHFYTNMLNLIYMLACDKDYQTIQELARHMTGYFRYLLSLQGDYTSLENELQCISSYTQVQKIRYQENFILQINCEVETNVEIPALLIQTFVENSIKHNVMVVHNLVVELDIEEKENRLIITVQDNGTGFAPDMLEQIQSGSLQDEGGKHIGICNVLRRLRVLYEDRAVIEIKNKEIGSIVSISLPHHMCNKDKAAEIEG